MVVGVFIRCAYTIGKATFITCIQAMAIVKFSIRKHMML